MDFNHREIAEYLEYKICGNEYDDREYGLYIEYKKYSEQVFEWNKNKKLVLKLEREIFELDI